MNNKIFPAKFAPEWPYHTDYTYDIECYPNFFSLAARHMQTGALYFFEISDWVDDSQNLVSWLYWLNQNKCRMIGFNNLGYDYPVVHHIFMTHPSWPMWHCSQKARAIYQFSSSMFQRDDEDDEAYKSRKRRFVIYDKKQIVQQIDLFKIYHFDNVNKSTSLKVLQINMRSDDVEDLPIKPGTVLTAEQRAQLIPYNIHDTDETQQFAHFSLDEIKLREKLSTKFGINMLNNSEGKIGRDVMKPQLIAAGLNVEGKTPRARINVRDIIFPYIRFSRPEFNEILHFLQQQVIFNTKGVKYPCVQVDGFGWQFSQGGMHASIESTIVRADDQYEIIDVDVESFYPKTAIQNQLYPAHLGPAFTAAYQSVFDMRKEYPKATHPMENLAFKYALNIPYGDSNNAHSYVYDPLYTMSITINGQLLLCMLGEWLLTVPGVSMIQANTDGITFKAPRAARDRIKQICAAWEQYTCLKLEYAYYQAMYIRDVNNYIAHYVPDEKNPEGKRKLKGDYVHQEIPWHKDHSAVVIARAVEQFFIFGVPVIETIMGCRDPFDFMIKGKVPRSSQLWLSYPDGRRQQLQNTIRYYVSNNGGQLQKVMPPTDAMRDHWYTGTHYLRARDEDYKVVKPGGKRPARTYDEIPKHLIAPEPSDRVINLESGWLASDCSRSKNFDWSQVNYAYYIKRAMKLIDPLMKQ